MGAIRAGGTGLQTWAGSDEVDKVEDHQSQDDSMERLHPPRAKVLPKWPRCGYASKEMLFNTEGLKRESVRWTIKRRTENKNRFQ